MLGAGDLGADGSELLLELGSALLGGGVRFGECVAGELFVAVERDELVEDGLFDFVAGEPFAVAGFRAVLLAPGAGVVVVAATVAVCAHADVRLAALPAAKQPGKDKVGCVAAPLRVVAALVHDRLRLGEGELVHQGLVDAVKDLVAPADLPDVGRVVDDPVHGRMPPARGRCGRSFVAQLLRDRPCAKTLARIQVEHAAHDWGLHRIGDEYALLVREHVAERRAATEPATFFRATFDARANAVDDGRVLELGEHRQHLQHHPTGRRAGVERFGR